MVTEDHKGRDELFLQKLRQIVLDNLSNEQFGVEDLAKSYGISRSQLHRKLRKLQKKSISQFIREIRLEEALKLLQKDAGIVSEIAYQVGFGSPTYFNTTFRNHFGYPPGEAKHRIESKTSTDLSKTSGSPLKKRYVLIGLGAIVIIALAWFAFRSYQSPLETEPDHTETKEKSIAVLPFKNWSGDPKLEYVSDGMTDAVILRLSKISDIDRIIPFSSMIRYKNTDISIKDIAKELDVQFVLEGNFKLSGVDVQSNLNLIEVDTEKHIWSMEYTGFWKSDQIFEMQAEVAENIAQYMQADIIDTEKLALERKPTENEEAYKYFLQAEYQFQTLSFDAMENSIRLYEQSIALDSNFVEPYIGLAGVYHISGLVWGLLPQQKAWALNQKYLKSAIERDIYGEHKVFLEMLLRHGRFYYELDISTVEMGYLASNAKEAIYQGYSEADYARKTGRFESALSIINKQLENDPTWSLGYMQKGILNNLLGKKEEALKIFSSIDPILKDNYFYLQESAKWYYYMGYYDNSKQNFERLLVKSPVHPPIVHWLMAVHAELNGDQEILDRSLAKLEEFVEQGVSGSPAWFLAMYYFHTNELNKAFNWLQRSYDRREVELTWLKEEPMLQDVKNDPRYIEIYNKLGFNMIEKLPLD